MQSSKTHTAVYERSRGFHHTGTPQSPFSTLLLISNSMQAGHLAALYRAEHYMPVVAHQAPNKMPHLLVMDNTCTQLVSDSDWVFLSRTDSDSEWIMPSAIIAEAQPPFTTLPYNGPGGSCYLGVWGMPGHPHCPATLAATLSPQWARCHMPDICMGPKPTHPPWPLSQWT